MRKIGVLLYAMRYVHDRRVRPHYKRVKIASFVLVSLVAVGAIGQYKYGVGMALLPTNGAESATEPTTDVSNQKNRQNGSTHAVPSASSQVSSSAPGSSNGAMTQLSAQRQTDCNSGQPIHTATATSSVAQLKAVSYYESLCGAGVVDAASFFAPTPSTPTQALAYAQDMVANLRAFAKVGVTPLVFFEPTSEGAILDFTAYRNGAYDNALDTYFASIRQSGISDAGMGTWVSFPEGNIPVWTSVDPSTYAANVTKTMQIMKRHFPAAKAGLLLDSATYPSATSWSGAQFVSLNPYIQNIPAGLIDSFGLQGFPWSPPANEAGPQSFNPSVYLNVAIAAEAAHKLGVSNVWLNTGTFSTAYAANPQKRVTVQPEQRAVMLDGVLAQSLALKKQGFQVAVHLFSEDKSHVSEGIDWSYVETTQSVPVFQNFAHNTNVAGVSLWLFDVR